MEARETVILVVDDQPANLKVLISFLQEHQFKTRIADTGERALRALEQELPDLILLDVMMPGMDGFEICRRIRADEKSADIPIIFMTALDSVEDKVMGFEAGGNDYITKPYQQAEVLARINTHIGLRRKSLALEQALAEIKVLSGILPICCCCKKIRDDEGYWQQVEAYISKHSEAKFSHGYCPACDEKEMEKLEQWQKKNPRVK
jgi:DNA-binding response OmpR family regulator